MIHDDVYRTAGVENGKELPYYAWPGGYPVIYYADDMEIICPKCVNEEKQFKEENYNKQWDIIGCDVYWEGPVVQCCNCNAEIESAYGDPHEEETE